LNLEEEKKSSDFFDIHRFFMSVDRRPTVFDRFFLNLEEENASSSWMKQRVLKNPSCHIPRHVAGEGLRPSPEIVRFLRHSTVFQIGRSATCRFRETFLTLRTRMLHPLDEAGEGLRPSPDIFRFNIAPVFHVRWLQRFSGQTLPKL